MYGSEAVSSTEESRDRKAAQARDRRAATSRRKEATRLLKSVDTGTVRKAVARAPRQEKDAADRQRKIGKNVASLVAQLVFWEGKGEGRDNWVHKTAADWELAEDALTYWMLRTARQVAVEEGLLEYKQGLRPGDRRPTGHYRLNLLEVARVVAQSELETTKQLLKREGRSSQRDQLNRNCRKWEKALEDLCLIDIVNENDEPVPSDPDAISSVQTDNETLTTCQGYRTCTFDNTTENFV